MATKQYTAKAEIGQQGALDWLSVKIIECLVKPMDETVARELATYNSAYEAISKRCPASKEGGGCEEPAHHLSSSGEISLRTAKEWCDGMKNADGTTGPHWTLDEMKQVQAERSIGGSPTAFWVAMNATYSDLCLFFKKFNISTIDAYANFVKDFWLEDKDARKGKLYAYYKNVVSQG